MEPLVGEIKMFAGNYPPRGWAFCEGQLLNVSQNTVLFTILGTTYGGDGRTTFALPDLRGRLPMHPGQGPGLSQRDLGEQGGSETVTLLQNQMPAHNHILHASTAMADQDLPTGNVPAVYLDASAQPAHLYAATPNTSMNPTAISATGGNQPHDNMPPFTCINFIIALEGYFPVKE